MTELDEVEAGLVLEVGAIPGGLLFELGVAEVGLVAEPGVAEVGLPELREIYGVSWGSVEDVREETPVNRHPARVEGPIAAQLIEPDPPQLGSSVSKAAAVGFQQHPTATLVSTARRLCLRIGHW